MTKHSFGFAVVDKDGIPCRDLGAISSYDDARVIAGTYNIDDKDIRAPYRAVELFWEDRQ